MAEKESVLFIRKELKNELAEALGIASADYSEFSWKELLTLVDKQRMQIVQVKRIVSDEA